VSRLIHQISSADGTVVTEPKEMSNIFSRYYSKLYSSEMLSWNWSEPNPLDYLTFPQINAETFPNLGAPITVAEVKEAIQSLQSSKSPGPDGYSAEFFKMFAHVLAPVLTRVFNDAFVREQLPSTFSEASISLLLKKEKDPLQCSSYRTISLLNVDFKILSKVLALRIQKVTPVLINADQTGFIRGRQSFFNTRRLLNIISSSSDSDPAEIVLSLECRKGI